MFLRLEHDAEADAVYVWFSDQPVTKTRTVRKNRSDAAVDYGVGGSVVGVELLGVSHGIDLRGTPEAGALAVALREAGFMVISGAPVDRPAE